MQFHRSIGRLLVGSNSMSVKVLILVQLFLLAVVKGQGTESKPNIIEGDILADQGLLRWIEKSDVNRQKREVVKGVNGEIRLWKNGLIPYVISSDISAKARKVIRRAFRRFAAKTCIRFIPKQAEHTEYIHFMQGVGCYSSVGRKTGRQVISLGLTCQRRFKVVHEIMHALGFFHEHSRYDRDDYVKILYWNIAEDQEKNFNIYSQDHLDILSEPYDYQSIMHYENKAFSKNGKDTIQVRNNPHMKLGSVNHLSKIDVRKIKKLYNCERHPKPNGGTHEPLCKDGYNGCKTYTENSDSCENNYEFLKLFCEMSCGFCGNG